MNSLNDNSILNAYQTQGSVFDLQSLRRLTDSMSEKNQALTEAAKQFEGIFIRQLLTSMRKVNDVFKEDGLFDSSSSDFYQGMWDDQIASNMSSNNSSSISSMLVQQLGGENKLSGYKAQSSSITSQLNPAVVNNSPNKPLTKELLLSGIPISKDKPSIIQKNINLEPESFSTKQDFIDYLLPFAKQAAEQLGSSPKVLLAQAALETGWGKYFVETSNSSSSKNLFNIKDKSDWHGDVAIKNSLEFDGNKFNLKKSAFRVYGTFKESFDDFVDFLSSRERYSSVVNNVSDIDKYLSHLQSSGYATDPDYSKKINSILKSSILQKIKD